MNTLETKKVWSDLESEIFYQNLLQEALVQIPETGAVMVLGPMFIINSPEENFALFYKAQKTLTDKGLVVFNQIPFVDYNIEEAPFNYAIKFEKFYKPLIQSGKITACYILPHWEKSEGTKSEIEYAREVGLPIYEI
jgi:hypothetical protein